MSINAFRRIFQYTGLDVTRYRPQKPLLYFLLKHKIQTVFDVGANIGQFSTLVREVLPEAGIYAFEPVKECYEQLILGFSNDKEYHPYHMALGASKSESVIHKNEYLPSSSILQTTLSHTKFFPHTEHTTDETVQIERLDDLHIDIKRNALLKMDVQGYEMEVLKGATRTLKNIDVVITEVSYTELYKGQPLFDDIYRYMVSQNFHYQGSLQAKRDPSTDMILFEDAVFVRS
jgi:FkbM family methyltransferase